MKRPEQVIVTHWMNPPCSPVLEVVAGDETSTQTRTAVVELLKQLERSPVVLAEVVLEYLINE